MHNVHIVQFVSLPTKQAKGSRQKNGRFTVSLAVRGGGGQLPRLAWGKEVPKKRDFNFDCQYFGQISLFSPMWGIFGTGHA